MQQVKETDLRFSNMKLAAGAGAAAAYSQGRERVSCRSSCARACIATLLLFDILMFFDGMVYLFHKVVSAVKTKALDIDDIRCNTQTQRITTTTATSTITTTTTAS